MPLLLLQTATGPAPHRDPCAVRLRTPRLPDLLVLIALALIVAFSAGCDRAPAAQEVAENLRASVASLEQRETIQNEPLLQKKAVVSFYEGRKFARAWNLSRDPERVVEAIRGIERDGLDPTDYHLAAIEELIRQRKEAATAELDANLDMLLTDAVAAMIDHMKYGRVRPASLNPKWNVNPREGATPLNEDLLNVVGAGDFGRALADLRHNHFIYQGLVQTLAHLRKVEAEGGWPVVPAGKSIRPGVTDRRIPVIRARLLATGELPPGADTTSTKYDAKLRQAVELFQSRHRLDENGVIDKDTIAAMNVSAKARVDQVRVNLERARWVLGGLDRDFLLVNLPAFKAYLIRGGQNVWEARTMIGQEARQTPSFRAKMQTVVFNPDWTVPPTILEEDVAKGIQEGRDMIAEKNLTVLDGNGNEVDPGSIDWASVDAGNFPYTLRQPPGPGNALGRLKFEFPNPYLIYLHDTPSKELFDAEKRTFSSGCIRIENPIELAEQLLGPQGWDRGRIEEMIAAGETKRVALETQLPVLLVYWTVSVGKSGEVRYMKDIYDLDAPVLSALNGRGRTAARS